MCVPPAWRLSSPAYRDGPELITKSSCSPELTWLPDGGLRNAGCASLLPDICFHKLVEMVLNWPHLKQLSSWTDLISWRWPAQCWMRVPPAWHLSPQACNDGPKLTTKSSCSPELTWLPDGGLRNTGCASLLPDICLHKLVAPVTPPTPPVVLSRTPKIPEFELKWILRKLRPPSKRTIHNRERRYLLT